MSLTATAKATLSYQANSNLMKMEFCKLQALLDECSDEKSVQLAFKIAEMKKEGLDTSNVRKQLSNEIFFMMSATRLFLNKTEIKKHK